MHFYITKYQENGTLFAESWLQINIFKKSYCVFKRRLQISATVA
ncbi:hypothetical protein [Leuconostoc fallax]|nr:hypothetical protein [Leuconostoc fallax]